MTKTVIILGAGWAGLPLTHKLLKYTLPKSKDGLKVFLVSPNTHFYWNVAATRGIIPGAIPDEQLFLPIEPGFAQYSAHNFEFVLGKAAGIDLDNSTVQVTNNDKTERSILYDHLVIATGSQIRGDLPFKPIGAHDQTIERLHALQKQIDVAKSIVVAGAGPTGIEVAGELAAAYSAYSGKKEITLIIGGDHVLESSPVLPGLRQVIEQDLQKLGVKLIRNTRVADIKTTVTGGAKNVEQTTLTLSTGSTLVTDLYIPLFGVQVNTTFVPSSLLDSSGNLQLDKTMRVTGTTNIWGIGDVGNLEAKQLTVTDAQIIHLSGALDSVLTTEAANMVKEYKPSGNTMVFISMGKKYATGQIGEWKLFGWMVSWVKGRSLFVDTAQGYVGGKQLRHASM
jgi:NADH dehydrogenase FAD-containing subunit